MILAYVFWHWPIASIHPNDYERALRKFYRRLRNQRPDGFIDCFGFRLESFPWKAESRRGYEDWYLVDNFSSLGLLNDAAVSKQTKASHDNIAKYAESGTGGIYKLIEEMVPARTKVETWFGKPMRMSYKDLKAYLESKGLRGIWQRQMTLGPAPEFCLCSTTPARFRDDFKTINIKVHRI